jgi:transposase
MSSARQASTSEKGQRLRAMGCLNPKSEMVKEELFRTDVFFDPRDLVQVKYEMIRRVRADKYSVSRAASDFGFSRVAFYRIRDALEKNGLGGLVAKKRGPRTRHKVTEPVFAFIKELTEKGDGTTPTRLCAHVKERFGLQVHPRSIRRALEASKKK